MKLSAPIYRLKRQAKILSRTKSLRLHEALDQIANNEGFACWSHLSSHAAWISPAKKLIAGFKNGEFVLLGARPGHGKTQLSLEIAVEAMSAGFRAVFFSLEYSEIDIYNLFKRIGRDPADYRDRFEYDTSDSICAKHIIGRLSKAPVGTVVIVDYLQLLDQDRSKPELKEQIRELKLFAKDRQIVMVFISQIDRSFDLSNRSCPNLDDLRLPNPVDLSLFTKSCFLNNGEIHVS